MGDAKYESFSIGCSHGCIYCDSRSKCYHIEHNFEDIEIKANAIELLENALKRKRAKCMLGTGSMTDPYIPITFLLEKHFPSQIFQPLLR